MQAVKNKLANWLFRLGTRLLYGWWPEHVNVTAVPPEPVRTQMLQELRERDLGRAQMIAQLVERSTRDDWPDLYELPPVNMAASKEWN
jgi:hypothetical protein